MIGTGISWCDDTHNLWWGCTKHGPGCLHCYAEALATRYGFDVWGAKAPRRFFADSHRHELDKLNRLALEGDAEHGLAPRQSRRVFVGSMMDICEDRPDLVPIASEFMASLRRWPWLDFLLLTKRPERFPLILPADWGAGYSNVWLVASAVTQDEVARNAEALRQVPAAVRGLSMEPLLEPVRTDGMPWINWRIVGGESGARDKARPFDPGWAQLVIEDAHRDGAAAFVKQFGTRWASSAGMLSRKADKPSEWPRALRVQDHPRRRRTTQALFPTTAQEAAR